MFGGSIRGYVEVWEFENLAESEKFSNRIMQDKEFITNIYAELPSLLVPSTHSVNIWNSVM